jgi:hypothetical protein
VLAVFGMILFSIIGMIIGSKTDIKRAIEEEGKVEIEVQKLIPLPGAKEVKRNLFHKEGHASVSVRYAVNKTYEEIRSYYSEEAKRNGWTLLSEEPLEKWGKDFGGKQLVFIKNSYTLTIDYWGEKKTDDLTYSIYISW